MSGWQWFWFAVWLSCMAALIVLVMRDVRARRRRNAAPVIVSTPGVLSGRPRINGTRIPAEWVIGLLDDGYSDEQISALYPSVARRQIAVLRSERGGAR